MTHSRAIIFVSLMLTLFSMGCDQVTRSTNVDTAGFNVGYTLLRDGDDVQAFATFREPGGARLELVDGDAVFVDDMRMLPTHYVPPTEVSVENSDCYQVASTTASTHTFRFERDGEGPYTHVVSTPSPFVVSSNSLSGSYDDTYTLTWGAPEADATIRIQASGEGCATVSLTLGEPDTGSYQFAGTALRQSRDTATTTCHATLYVTRTSSQELGAPFQYGLAHTVALARIDMVIQ